MNYDDKLVCQIAEQYHLLCKSVDLLEDGRKDMAVLAWMAQPYISAENALNFLQSTPDKVKETLKIGQLEKKLSEFANITIG